MKRTLAVASAVACMLVAAACGGPGSAGDAKKSGAGSSDSLRVVQSSTSVGFFAMYVAAEEGFYKQEGVNVGAPTILGGDSKVAAALAGGSADIGGGVATTAFLLADGKRNPVIVANLLNSYYVDVIVGKQFKQPPADASLEDKIRALKGARIGVPAPSGGGAALMQFLFNKVGMDVQKDVRLVNLGGQSSAALGALKTDRVNVLVFFQPIGQAVESAGTGSIYISPSRGDVPDMTDQPHGVALTTKSVLESKPDAVKAFVRAIAKAEELIHSDPQKARELFTKYQNSLDPATIDKIMPVLQKEVPTNPALTEDGYTKTLKFHQVAGLAKSAPTWAEMSGDDFAGKADE